MPNTHPNNEYALYFTKPSSASHKHYLALRRFFADGCSAEQVANECGFTTSTVYSMVRDFKKEMSSSDSKEPFFKDNKTGRKPVVHKVEVEEAVINLRKKYFSVPDILIATDAMGFGLTIYSIEKIITEAGFARLPRRDSQFKNDTVSSYEPKLAAPISSSLLPGPDEFSSHLAGLLCILPFIAKYGIGRVISESTYPGRSGTRSGKRAFVLWRYNSPP
jgi:transposase